MNDPSAAPPASTGNDEEVVLRLGDVLRRIPPQALKPGPHDPARSIRFSVDEFAEQIARGRVSVRLSRLAAACPDIFEAPESLPEQEEIHLPLQKLLDQIGLVANGPSSSNGSVPKAQVEQARAEAGRILRAAGVDPNAPRIPPRASPAAEPPPPDPVTKALSAAKQFLGLFGRPKESDTAAPRFAPPRHLARPAQFQRAAPAMGRATAAKTEGVPERPAPAPVAAPEPVSEAASSSEPGPALSEPNPAQSGAASAQAGPAPAPEGFISLGLAAIFRLLPDEVLRREVPPPPAEARAILPLSLLDPQLALGHVEIPLEELAKAIPENLRASLRPTPDAQVWIPLDEIFQNLPASHLFYMPPLENAPENVEEKPANAPTTQPEAKPEEGVVEAASAEAPAEADEAAASPGSSSAEEAPRAEAAVVATEGAPVGEATPDRLEPSEQGSVEAHAQLTPEPRVSPAPEAAAEGEAAPAAGGTSQPDIEPGDGIRPNPEVAPEPEHQISDASEPIPQIPSLAVEKSESSPPPWMHGFRVPPPRLFSAGGAEKVIVEAPAESSLTKTPEAKQTVDFLTGQPGIFAAAAFVEGAIFASADFPRKPDLDTLRDVIGAFVQGAKDSAQRLGWSGVLTLACEQFFVTAVIRDHYFVAALHHDRVLTPLAHQALVGAAERLGTR